MSESSPAKDAWNAAVELLVATDSLSSSQQAFVRMVSPLGYADEIFMVAVGSDFVKSWLEEHVAAHLISVLSKILGRTVRLMISVDPSLIEAKAADNAEQASQNAVSAPPAQAPVPAAAPASSPVQTPRPTPRDVAEARGDVVPRPELASRDERAPRETTATFADAETSRYYDLIKRNTEGYNLPAETVRRAAEAHINPLFDFDTFVIGENNRFAAATSLAVAESPGSNYNPLFLYSDSGMGKTHLMHAIGNYAMSLYEDIKVRYITSEEFTNVFINAYRDNDLAAFKDQFRSVDILLIDDIQFLGMGDKTQTLEEFFHTFNALTQANKQIVITSDVAPNLLNGFEERMISRFISGLPANIDRPGLETRIAILEKKAEREGLHVPREVNEYIATHITTNVREMEGALRRVTASAGFAHQPVSLAMAEAELRDFIGSTAAVEITASLIMAQTSGYFNISLDDMVSSDRSRDITIARQIAMYLCREMTDLSLPKIGSIFGKRDHTTVMHACRKIDKQMTERQQTYNQVSELTSRIKQAAQQQAF